MRQVRLECIYDLPSPDDSIRLLVDRLWPRGLKRDFAKIDLWPRAVAPRPELRRWFGRDPNRWAVFERRSRAELTEYPGEVATLHNLNKGAEPLTLLFAAKDAEHNNGLVLRDFAVSA